MIWPPSEIAGTGAEALGGICDMKTEDLLKEIPLFHNLKKNELELILRSARRVTYSAGRTIVREARVGAAFFVIVSGRVEVIKAMDGPNPQVLATLGPGDFFGEIASVKHLPRSASVRALEDTECLVIWR